MLFNYGKCDYILLFSIILNFNLIIDKTQSHLVMDKDTHFSRLALAERLSHK